LHPERIVGNPEAAAGSLARMILRSTLFAADVIYAEEHFPSEGRTLDRQYRYVGELLLDSGTQM
jgi:hypothetical protein